MEKAERRGQKAEGRRQKAFCLLFLGLASCAPKAPTFPTGSASPFPEYEQAWTEASRDCAAARTLTASVALSGRVRKTKLRGRIDAGFAAPSSVRLEGVAPFGRPIFVLVATGDRGTLVLPRDNRVLRDAPPEQIVEALAGVPFGAADLLALITGCGLSSSSAPTAGSAYPDGWVAVQFARGYAYLRQVSGRWRVAAASEAQIAVHYELDRDGRASAIRVLVTDPSAAADLTLRISELDVNVALDPRTFAVEVPAGAEPITLDELRRAGPLGR
jgi:outer membrane lipoprotein-sorting protein